MQKQTKWGLFIGNDEDLKAFEKVMTEREQPKETKAEPEPEPVKVEVPVTVKKAPVKAPVKGKKK